MRALEVEYLAPARFDDLIEAFVRIRRIGRTSITYECAAYRLPDETLMVEASQTLVLVDRNHRPTPVPDSFRKTVRRFEGEDLEE
jgi:acyl-CoA thioester hydrolase